MKTIRRFFSEVVKSRSHFSSLLFIASLAVLTLPQIAAAQGFLVEPMKPRQLPRVIRPHFHVPTPQTTPYTIESEVIDASLDGTIAQVNVSQTFKNESSSTVETAFIFPIPYDGAIDSMTLLVDGKELPATLLNAEEARKQYEEIVRKAKDPALLEWIGYGLYRTSVFPIPAGEKRTVSLRYTQLLRSDSGLVEFFFPMSATKYTLKSIPSISFNITIKGDSEIKNVYSPTYDLKVERASATNVTVKTTLKDVVPNADFRLFFDQSADDVSTKLISYRPNEQEDGYFLLLASPKIVDEGAETIPRTIVFCLDVSGSMLGPKIEQARESLKFVLQRLRPTDKFNIVLFGSDVVSFKNELQESSEANRAEGIAYVNSVRASGSTNIEKALQRSFELLQSDESDNPKYLVFLSDGEPTIGECNEMKLAEIARKLNTRHARFFSFGLGYDVHARLLDRFVRDGRGRGEYVKPEEKIEDRVAAFYTSIDAPVLANVEFKITLADAQEKNYIVNRVYPNDAVDLFAGEQLVMVGRYSESGDVLVSAKGKIRDKEEEMTFKGTFTSKSGDATNAFVERLWANRRVGEIIDELDLNGMNDELLKELVELSKKHGIMTPYTSFLALEQTELNAMTQNVATAESNFRQLAADTTGMQAVMQRQVKQGMRSISNLNGAQAKVIDSSNSMMDAGSVDESMGVATNMAQTSRGMSSFPFQLRKRAPVAQTIVTAQPIPSPIADDVANSPNESIRNVAGKTFFLRDGRWIDSSITEELEKETKPIEIVQFSDEYFKVVQENGQSFSQYLAFDEPVLLNYNGQLYSVELSEE